MIFVFSIEVFVAVTLPFLSFFLSEDAVVPLLYPRHGFPGDTVIAYKVCKTGWAVTIHPKSILWARINLLPRLFYSCARELVKTLKYYEALNALLLQVLS
jgi:hypothetical protein